MTTGSEKRRILVTGGAGYIGSHTVRALLEAGEQVTLIDSLVHGHREVIERLGKLGDLEFVEGEIGDPAALDRAFGGGAIDSVLHFAAFCYVGESVSDPLKYYRNNTAAPIALIEAMAARGVGQFVFSSTCATYGDPQYLPLDENHQQVPVNPYGWSKLMTERVLRDCETACGIRSVFLRYFNASGCSHDGLLGEDHDPETHLIPRILMAARGEIDSITVFGTDYPTPDGTCIRDYIHVEDLAAAHLAALEYLRRGGETTACNLGTGAGFSVRQIIDAVRDVTGRDVPVEFGERRPGDPAELVAKPDRARDVLGWEARRKDVREIIETAWQWMNGPKGGRYEGN